MLKTLSCLSLLLCLLAGPLAHGTPEEPPLEQVVVEATRENLVKLGTQVAEAEARFYARYNELNKVRKYAVQCLTEASTGTRFTSRSCKPVFESEAAHAEARNFVMALQVQFGVSGNPPLAASLGNSAPPAIAGGMPSAPTTTLIESGRPGFRQNMIDVTRNNPDLATLAGEYAQRVKRWSDMYRKINGARTLPETK